MMMAMSPFFLASVLLCFVIGAVIDTSNICLVSAARQLIAGRPAVLCGILVSTGAASVIYYANTVLGWHHRDWLWCYPSWFTVVGAAMFAVGAVLNGACAVGTVTRIARGDLGHLSTFAGAAVAAWLLPPSHVVTHLPEQPILSGTEWVCAVLGFTAVVLWLCRRQVAGVPWASFAAVGATAGLITDWEGNWTWLSALQRLQSGLELHAPVLILIGAVLLGVLATTVLRGHFHLQRPRSLVMLREFVGGGLMLGGAILIPGANDALAAFGVPSGSPDAIAGYAVMFTILMMLVWTQKIWRSGVAQTDVWYRYSPPSMGGPG